MAKKRQFTLTLILILFALFLIAQQCSTAITFDSAPQGADVYIDGELKGQTPVSVLLATGPYNIKYSLEGYQDLVFDLSVTLGMKEVKKTLVPLAAGCPDADADGYCGMPSGANILIGFDDGNAPFHDITAGNDAAICTEWCPAVVPGKVGNAVQFDGTNYLSISDSDDLTLSGDFTISMWIKTSMPKLSSYLHSVVTNWQVDTQQPFWAIEAANGRLSYRTRADDGTWNGDGTGDVISDGNWHHFALTRSADTWKFYIDGELNRISPVKSSSAINPALETRIGQSVDGGYGFNGFIDQLSIFNRALSELEIKEISRQVNSFDCDDDNANANPGNAEVCGDSVDNNCDGVADEGCPFVCTDEDGDGICADAENPPSSGNVLWMRMDEDGGPIMDSSVNGNNGGIAGEVNYNALGVSNFALDFLGTNIDIGGNGRFLAPSRVSVQNSASLNSITNQITIAAWVKSLGNGNDRTFVNKCVYLNSQLQCGPLWRFFMETYQEYSWLVFTGKFTDNTDFVVSSQGTAGLPSNLPFNTWQHIAVTYDGTNITIYLNGNAIASQSYPGKTLKTNDHGLRIGGGHDRDAWYSYYDTGFKGYMDEVLIYNRALSEEEIRNIYDVGVLDCDDYDAKTYPSAAEICGDSKDNDCDGVVDNGCDRCTQGLVKCDGFQPQRCQVLGGQATYITEGELCESPLLECRGKTINMADGPPLGRVGCTEDVFLHDNRIVTNMWGSLAFPERVTQYDFTPFAFGKECVEIFERYYFVDTYWCPNLRLQPGEKIEASFSYEGNLPQIMFYDSNKDTLQEYCPDDICQRSFYREGYLDYNVYDSDPSTGNTFCCSRADGPACDPCCWVENYGGVTGLLKGCKELPVSAACPAIGTTTCSSKGEQCQIVSCTTQRGHNAKGTGNCIKCDKGCGQREDGTKGCLSCRSGGQDVECTSSYSGGGGACSCKEGRPKCEGGICKTAQEWCDIKNGAGETTACTPSGIVIDCCNNEKEKCNPKTYDCETKDKPSECDKLCDGKLCGDEIRCTQELVDKGCCKEGEKGKAIAVCSNCPNGGICYNEDPGGAADKWTCDPKKDCGLPVTCFGEPKRTKPGTPCLCTCCVSPQTCINGVCCKSWGQP